MLLIEQYLSELTTEKLRINEFYLSLIDSPTGSGKTYKMFQEVENNPNEKYIICFPYVTQCQAYKNKLNFQFLYGDKTFDIKGPKTLFAHTTNL